MTESLFRFCLNTSTVQGQQLGLLDQIDLAGAVGYDGIEIWISSLDEHLRTGGTLDEVRVRADDRGVAIENAIGFAPWIVDAETDRRRGLDEMARDMEILAGIGCARIAAPPFGATDHRIDLDSVAQRFVAVVEIGRAFAVTPQLELWGFSETLGVLQDLLFVAQRALDSDKTEPSIRFLLDSYHLHRGGSDYHALAHINGSSLEVFHLNDFPTDVAAVALTDADRVYPGDGSGPIAEMVGLLHAKGSETVLSLELFNRRLWEEPAEQVARVGLAKMRRCVEAAVEDAR